MNVADDAGGLHLSHTSHTHTHTHTLTFTQQGNSVTEAAMAGFAPDTGTSMGSIFIKLAGDARARFAEVAIFDGDTVTRLAKRASRELDWRTSAAYVELFLVKSAGSEQAFTTPTQAQIDAVLADERNVLGEGMPLSRAGIVSGAWVVARLTDPSAAVPGECVRETASLLSCSSSWRPEGLAGRARDSTVAWGATPLSLVSLPSHCRRQRRWSRCVVCCTRGDSQ